MGRRPVKASDSSCRPSITEPVNISLTLISTSEQINNSVQMENKTPEIINAFFDKTVRMKQSTVRANKKPASAVRDFVSIRKTNPTTKSAISKLRSVLEELILARRK